VDDRIAQLEGVCEHAFYFDLALSKCEHRVEKVDGEEDDLRGVAMPPLVVSLARLLSARFRRAAAEDLDEATSSISGATTTAALAAAVAALSDRLGRRVSEETAADMKRSVESMLQTAKLGASRELGMRPTLRLPDSRMQEWLSHAYPWWVGSYHSDVLGKQIMAIAQRAIIERGLSGREAADLVRSQLTRLYGLGRGEKSPVAVPRSFRGNPDAYWAGLANHAATTANVFARLSAMEEAGVVTYVVRTAGDERVCGLCRFMEGREFKVASGVGLREQILKASTPEEYKAVVPWRTLKQAKAIFDGGGDVALAAAGLGLPSYHLQCRCDIYARES